MNVTVSTREPVELSIESKIRQQAIVSSRIVIERTEQESYTGPLEVTPNEDTQTLNTAGKFMDDDIVVNPVPANYGKITRNDAFLTIS